MSQQTVDSPLPQRTTRGKRMKRLMGEELEADEQFWNQEFFKEDEHDGEYEVESEEEDVVDSDFDQDEADDDEDDGEEDEKAAKQDKTVHKKRSVYVDRGSKKITSLSEVPHDAFSLELAAKNPEEAKKQSVRRAKSNYEGHAGHEVPRSLRTSTQQLTKAKEIEWDIRKQIHEEKKKKNPRKQTEHILLTQEELLEEAKITEQINTEALQQYLKLEEEKKKKTHESAVRAKVPMITYHSKAGVNTITFPDEQTLRQAISTERQPYPEPQICCITGLPAKYRDPISGKAYANAEAFRQIRLREAA
eukprot:TRINITY_DN5548_c0_g2_i1.p1 TRINITY_DN5548_c0_g2~~TRINITY_DN5548_c0_g2_i1.p1  ORF type:complete len:305 (-),score=85.00 TRINITY_DN5548_c0_g2_i1:34-948(-)